MKFFASWGLLATLFSAVSASDLLDELVQKRKSSATGIISVNTDSYQKYVLGERDYHLFVFYTATNTKCTVCQAANAPLDAVADTIRRAYPEATEDSQTSKLFIVKADYPKCQEIFQFHPNLTGVPHMIYVSPGKAVAIPPASVQKTTKWLPGYSSRNEYSVMSSKVDAGDILEWLHRKVREKGPQLSIYVDPIPGLIRMAVIIVTIPAAILLAMRVLGAHRICLAFAMVLIAFILGGGMWCLIRGAQPGSGEQWYLAYSSAQTQAELYVVGAIVMAGAAAVVMLNSDRVTGEESAKSGNSKYMVLVFAGAAAYAFWSLKGVYLYKNRSYGIYTA